jgi:hypothetical protein
MTRGSRTQGALQTNDGLFNLRALLSYRFSFRGGSTPRHNPYGFHFGRGSVLVRIESGSCAAIGILH